MVPSFHMGDNDKHGFLKGNQQVFNFTVLVSFLSRYFSYLTELARPSSSASLSFSNSPMNDKLHQRRAEIYPHWLVAGGETGSSFVSASDHLSIATCQLPPSNPQKDQPNPVFPKALWCFSWQNLPLQQPWLLFRCAIFRNYIYK